MALGVMMTLNRYLVWYAFFMTDTLYSEREHIQTVWTH
jgi:hypothetical protein